jgi:hypothetical protein
MKKEADERIPTDLMKTHERATGVSEVSLREAMKTTHSVHQFHLGLLMERNFYCALYQHQTILINLLFMGLLSDFHIIDH